MKDYDTTFTKDLDTLWENIDIEKNGYLDYMQTQIFLDEVAGCIDEKRASNYDKANFKVMFEKFDENKDKFLSKGEMAQFIKFAFKKSDAAISKSKAMNKLVN